MLLQKYFKIAEKFLPFDKVLHHFNQHNQYVIDMTIARNNENFELDIQLYDKYYSQILDMADFFLNGLVNIC